MKYLVCTSHKENFCMECAFLQSSASWDESLFCDSENEMTCNLIKTTEIPAIIKTKTEPSLKMIFSYSR